MQVFELREQYKEALSYHQILGELGFKPDDIYVDLRDGKFCVFIESNDKFLGFACGKLDISFDQMLEEWREAVTLWRDHLSESQVRQIYICSNAFHNKMNVVKKLIQGGVL
jgi:hypothetical protein